MSRSDYPKVADAMFKRITFEMEDSDFDGRYSLTHYNRHIK